MVDAGGRGTAVQVANPDVELMQQVAAHARRVEATTKRGGNEQALSRLWHSRRRNQLFLWRPLGRVRATSGFTAVSVSSPIAAPPPAAHAPSSSPWFAPPNNRRGFRKIMTDQTASRIT